MSVFKDALPNFRASRGGVRIPKPGTIGDISAAVDAIKASGGLCAPHVPFYGIPPFEVPEMTPEERFEFKLECGRSEDPDTAEGFYFAERFGEQCDRGWYG